MVCQGSLDFSSTMWMRLPTGSSPGQNCCAKCSSTITTLGAVALSRSSKSRPRRSGIPMASKKWPPTIRSSALMNFSPAGGVRPSIVIGVQAKASLRGRDVMAPENVVPGRCSRRSQS